MNKTIRHNCFETNSSSSHSLTFVSEEDTEFDVDLVTDKILYPGKLRETAAYKHSSNNSEWSSEQEDVVTASTRDQKAALFMHHVKNWSGTDYCEEPDDALKNKVIDIASNVLCELCGYSNVDKEFWAVFMNSPYYEIGEGSHSGYLNKMLNGKTGTLEIMTALTVFVQSVILNPKITIVEESKEY